MVYKMNDLRLIPQKLTQFFPQFDAHVEVYTILFLRSMLPMHKIIRTHIIVRWHTKMADFSAVSKNARSLQHNSFWIFKNNLNVALGPFVSFFGRLVAWSGGLAGTDIQTHNTHTERPST